MKIGRRPIFFTVLGVICLALVPWTPAEFRWLNIAMALLAAFWAIVLAVEDLAHARADRRRSQAP